MRRDGARVVITGYGALSPNGSRGDAVWEDIKNYRLSYSHHDYPDQSIKSRFFGFFEDERRDYKAFPKRLLRALPPFAKYAVSVTDDALQMAFPSGNPLDHYASHECGAIVGTGWGGVDRVNINNNEYRDIGFSSSYATLMSMNNSATAAISMHWDLKGYQNTVIAACASGLMAIGDAFEVIRTGRAKCMVAGGAESIKEVFNVWSIDVLEALSKEQSEASRACCPFDKRRSGFVLSEGAAMVCLEEYESAVKRGAPILAEITGYGNYSDAYDYTAPAPDLKAKVMAIQSALKQADLAPKEIDYVNLHGTSTPLNDLYETKSVKEGLGKAAYDIPMSSTKSYTGHLIGAAGSLETVFCLKSLESNVIPATVNLVDPDPECDLDYTPNEHRTDIELNRILKLSYGFGGANAALVLERVR